MSEPFVVALALEGQLRLDDQPALHRAVALARQRGQDQGQGHGQSQSQGKLIVLACRPQGQHLRGPHQRRLAAQALACLQARLAAEAIPLLHCPQHSTAAALEFSYLLGSGESLTLTAHAVYLPRPRIEIKGPKGVQASFDWQAALATSPARMCTVVLVNNLAGYP